MYYAHLACVRFEHSVYCGLLMTTHDTYDTYEESSYAEIIPPDLFCNSAKSQNCSDSFIGARILRHYVV